MSRVIVVTGGKKGIGKAVAERFSAGGDRVEAAGHDDLDVTDEDAVTAFFEQVGPADVLVNNAGVAWSTPLVCQIWVRTDMTRRAVERIIQATDRDEEQAEAELAAMAPLGRLLEPEEVAFAVEFFAAPEAAAINGQTLVLDGGGIQS